MGRDPFGQALTARDRGSAGGLLLGLAGVAIFSFSFPATKLALHGLDPWFIAFGRAALATAPAVAELRRRRAPRPSRAQWRRLLIVVGGVVIGFPLLSSLALTSTGSAHGAVVIAVLPAATAVAAVLRAGERPGPLFWLAAAAGAAIVTSFSVEHAGGELRLGDAYLLAAVVVCALGYAEGGALSRELGSVETISWALVLALPATLAVAAATAPSSVPRASAVAGFAYVGLGSMFVGFFAWYAGLARGGIARVGQLQLLQPFLTIALSALVLGERIGRSTIGVAVAVLASVVVTQRARVADRAPEVAAPFAERPAD